MTRARGFVRQSVSTLGSRLVVTLINIPISILVVRSLGAAGQGAYSAALAAAGLWAMALTLSLDAAHTYFLASRRHSLAEVAANSVFWLVLLGAIGTPLFMLLAPHLDEQQGSALQSVLAIAAAGIPLAIARSLVLAIFLGQERVDLWNRTQVVSSLVLLGLLALAFSSPAAGVRAAVYCWLGSVAVIVVSGAVLILRAARAEGRPFRLSRPLMRDGLAYGLKGHAGVFFAQFTYRFDQVLVTRMAGLDAQGFYSIAVLLAEKLTLIPQSVHLVLFPRVASRGAEDANRITPLACRLTLATVIPCAVALWVLAPPLVRLFYSKEFEPSLPAFQALLPGVIVLSLSRPLSGDLSGRNKRLAQTLALGSAFALNLFLDILWIPRHGIVGAAWASTVAYTWQTLSLVFLFSRASGVPPHRLFLPTTEDREVLGKLALRVRHWGGRG